MTSTPAWKRLISSARPILSTPSAPISPSSKSNVIPAVISLREYYSVDDCGPRISPLLVEGQIHGGLAQGIGQALLEEIVFDEQGQLLTGTMMDYAMPRADDFPGFSIEKTVTETTLNPLGAKGIGEAATIGSTPAVVNAVVDALEPYGVRHLDMPLTPRRIWEAMQSGQ